MRITIIGILLCLLMQGCQESSKYSNITGTFPKEYAGRWISDEYEWIIQFDENGEIEDGG